MHFWQCESNAFFASSWFRRHFWRKKMSRCLKSRRGRSYGGWSRVSYSKSIDLFVVINEASGENFGQFRASQYFSAVMISLIARNLLCIKLDAHHQTMTLVQCQLRSFVVVKQLTWTLSIVVENAFFKIRYVPERDRFRCAEEEVNTFRDDGIADIRLTLVEFLYLFNYENDHPFLHQPYSCPLGH